MSMFRNFEVDGWQLFASVDVDDPSIKTLAAGFQIPLAASISPTPSPHVTKITRLHTSAESWSDLEGPFGTLFALNPEAMISIGTSPDLTCDAHFLQRIASWANDARSAGWRHLSCSTLADAEDETTRHQHSLALDHQRLKVRVRTRAFRLVVDAPCFGAHSEFTGTHHLVAETVKHLFLQRDNSHITVRTAPNGAQQFRSLLSTELVGVGSALAFAELGDPAVITGEVDAVYRPYQFLRSQEIQSTFSAQRTIVGQLDMIGFSNPSYHPSIQGFHTTRNLQRATLRRADLVLTISNMARDHILAEVPDLEPRRLLVVPCGTDHVAPTKAQRPKHLPSEFPRQFLACLSATFWHKNRTHAIRTYLELRARGVDIGLVIAGPEPFYGSSKHSEDSLLLGIPTSERQRVQRLGNVSEAEKWWILAEATAVLYPSVNEGFGLVPFEAASVGTPTLCARTAALPEVLGGHVQLARSWAPTDWADVISQWMCDPAAANTQVDSIRFRSAELTWSETAKRTWEAIDLAVSLPKRIGHQQEGGSLLSMENHRIGPTRVAEAYRQSLRVRNLFYRKVLKRQ